MKTFWRIPLLLAATVAATISWTSTVAADNACYAVSLVDESDGSMVTYGSNCDPLIVTDVGWTDEACGCDGKAVNDCACESDWLGSILTPSDHCFDDFISPMTNPVFFEDPRTLTEARFIYMHHVVPSTALGGRVRLIGMQLRAALNDRLSIIAAKDGFISSAHPLIEDGWADVSAGLKYNLFKDYERQRILSLGAAYELPIGSRQSLQGNGDGEFHLFMTGATTINCDWHWISASGFRLPADSSAESQVWYWSNHLDRKLCNYFYALAELNWYHWMKSGKGGIDGIEGLDLINLGSTGVAGQDIVTGAVGIKAKPSGNMEIGVAFEFPVTEERDIIDNRLTVDWILRY